MEGFEEEFEQIKSNLIVKVNELENQLKENTQITQGIDQFLSSSNKKFAQIFKELEGLREGEVIEEKREEEESEEKDFELQEMNSLKSEHLNEEQVKSEPKPAQLSPSINKNINALEYSINELTDRLNDIERNLNKKMMSMDNKLRDLDELKKMSKLIVRLQNEVNQKVNQDSYDMDLSQKIDKNEFFEYVNKNLVYKDKIKTFQFEIQQLSNKIEEKVSKNN